VEITTPLKEPIYGYASMGGLKVNRILGDRTDYIFKGKLLKVSEVHVQWQEESTGGVPYSRDEWFSVCDVAIDKVLYGEVAGEKDTIKVVFASSTRKHISTEINLVEGQEYYFLTHVYDAMEKADSNIRVGYYKYGDVIGSTGYCLFPLTNGIVSFLKGWPFEGAKQPVVTEENFDTLDGVIATIDEESFLEQLQIMIKEVKGTPKPEP
jgi:hypothetical protein